MTKYICTRCGETKEFDDYYYAELRPCKNCGGYFTPDIRKDEEE